MKLIRDTDTKELIQEVDGQNVYLDLYSKEAFELLSHQWLKLGWNQKYTCIFSWMGRPIIQLPEDMIRLQEVIYLVKPDVIIETGIAQGCSLIYYASLCKAIEKGRVIGIDIEIRPHNRKVIESHELFPFITLVEGSSTAPDIISYVKSIVKLGEVVLVILDSCHTKQHVLDKLNAYHDLVTVGSYIVAMDGLMKKVHDVPRGNPEWIWDHPAAAEFAEPHPKFILDRPIWLFNENELFF